ncbi:MAG: EcsC family protein [Clostridiales bacterium]|nr:EcsC family protein [Clostridiales bacterium]
MSKAINKQLLKIEKKETRFLEKGSKRLGAEDSSLGKKLESKIPQKLKNTLYQAFYKSFNLVFDKGTAYIEKTYKKDDIQLDHELNDIAIDNKPTKKYLKRMDKQGNKSKLINMSIASLEGSVLGLLGIGIPDIPIIIALIMRQVYEISLSYGYDYKDEKERVYILMLICGALSSGSDQIRFNEKLDQLARQIDNKSTEFNKAISLDEQIKETSNTLADHLLIAKFIQGIPIVGLVGGAVNNILINRVASYARIKYKKRYLLSKIS